MKQSSIIILTAMILLSTSVVHAENYLPAVPALGATHPTLIFDEEFNHPDLNSNIWYTDFLGHQRIRPNELGYYSVDGVILGDGHITLQTSQTPQGGLSYTAGVLATYPEPRAGHTGFQQLYGIFEVKARVATTYGVKSDFWMKSIRGWPPEIDIFEIWGQSPANIAQTVHYKTLGVQNNALSYTYKPVNTHSTAAVAAWAAAYHTYTIEWRPNYITWYVDGVKTDTQTLGIPNTALYMILESDVEPSINGSSVFPSNYDIQYVRAWQ